MNYYTRTQQVLTANAQQSAARMAYLGALRGEGGLGRMGRMGQGGGAGLPAGSQLSYSAQFSIPVFGPVTQFTATSPADAANTIATQLASYGIQVISKTAVQSGTQVQVAMMLLTRVDKGAATDVQGIVDMLWQQQGAQSLTSGISVVNPGATSPGLPPQPADGGSFDVGQFLSDNWGWLALAAGALIFASEEL